MTYIELVIEIFIIVWRQLLEITWILESMSRWTYGEAWRIIDKGPSMRQVRYCILFCRHIGYPMTNLKYFGQRSLVTYLNIVWRHLERTSWKTFYVWKKCSKAVCLNIKQLQQCNQYIHDTMICHHYPCLVVEQIVVNFVRRKGVDPTLKSSQILVFQR